MTSPPRLSSSVARSARSLAGSLSRAARHATQHWHVRYGSAARLLLFAASLALVLPSVPGGLALKLWAVLVLASLLGLVSVPLLVFGVLIAIAGSSLAAALGHHALAEYLLQQAYYALWLIVVRQAVGLLLRSTRVGRLVWNSIAKVEANINRSARHVLRRAWAFFERPLVNLDVRAGQILTAVRRAFGDFHNPIPQRLQTVRARHVGLWLQRYGIRLILVALFIIPLFWFQNGEGDYGGDSSRLYFKEPLDYLRSMSLSAINSSGVAREYQQFFFVPFLLLLQGVRFLTLHRPSAVLSVFNGLLLAGAFVGVYLSIRDLAGRRRPSARAAALLGGLFFVFSQIVMYNWPRSPLTFHGIAVYPFLFWCGLRFLQAESKDRPKVLLGGVLLTVLFAPNFSAFAAPALFSFFPFAAVLLAAYAWIHGRLSLFFRGALAFLVLSVPVHAFHLLPQAAALADPGTAMHQALFSLSGRLDRGLRYFESLRPSVRLLYNLAGFHQYDLYVQTVGSPELLALFASARRFLPLFLAFPSLVLLGLLRGRRDPDVKQRAVLLMVVLLFLVSTFLLTANLFGALGPQVYAKFFSLPGFSMFRSFVGTFAVSFMFLYAVALGLSARTVFATLASSTARTTLAVVLGALLVWQARPFLNGTIVNLPLADTNRVKLAHRFRPEFDNLLQWTRTLPLDTKFLTLPWTAYDYQVVDGVSGGAYVGPPPLALLTGRQVFAGLSGFDIPGSEVLNTDFLLAKARERDYRTINRIFSRLNIGLAVYDASPRVYREAFSGWPYAAGIWEAFPESEEFRRMLTRLAFRPVYQRGPYTVFQYPEFFLPHLYVPLKTVLASSTAEVRELLVNTEQFDIRTATYIRRSGDAAVLDGMPATVADPPILEFRKILPTKYRVRVHRTRENFPLVFSELFHRGWKAYLTPFAGDTCEFFDEDGQGASGLSHARAADVQRWCEEKLVTASGPGYVSEPFNGTIQNDNLPDGRLWETWRRRPLDERTHLVANEYANSWWIDLEALEKTAPNLLEKRADGSYDFELVLEYTPQRYFYVGGVISVLTVALLLVWAVFAFRVRDAVQSLVKHAYGFSRFRP